MRFLFILATCVPHLVVVGAAIAFSPQSVSGVTAGWENVNPERREFPLSEVVWSAPTEGFRVEKLEGAEGSVRFEGGRIFVSKTNDRGALRIVAPTMKFDAKRHVRFSADVTDCRTGSVDGRALGGLSASDDGIRFPEWDVFRPERWFSSGGHAMRRIVNTAPTVSYRKYVHGISDTGEITPAIWVRGEASESVWFNWRAEYNDAAQDLWQRYRREHAMPDRRPEMEDEDSFARALAADADHTAEIRTVDGRSVFFVDGNPSVPMVYKQSHMFDSPHEYLTYAGRPLHDAGVKVGVIAVRFAGDPERCKPYWTKEGFDVKGMVTEIREEMRIAGPQVFLLTLSLDVYPEFSADYPEECWRKEDGSVACGTWGSVSADYDVGGNYSSDRKMWPWVSYASEHYRGAAKRCLSELVSELKRTGLSKRIIGFHLAGFHDGQFAMPFPDYSGCAKAAYANYLKRFPDTPFDYFSVQLGFLTQEDFARHLKREFGKSVIAVRWCMTPFGGGEGAHDVAAFVRSDVMDVIVPQTCYQLRQPGYATACNVPTATFHDHRKMLWYEFDHRNYTAIDTWGRSIIAQKGLNVAEDDVQWASIDRKHNGMMIAQRMGLWYYDMGGGWLRKPEIVCEVADVCRYRESMLGRRPSAWHPDVVWVIDERAICLYNRKGHPKVKNVGNLVTFAREPMGASAVPFEIRLVDDFIADPTLLKKYKAAVLAGFVCPDEAQRKVLDQFEKSGVKTMIQDTAPLSAKAVNAFARAAGAFVASEPGLQVDMSGDFLSVHAVRTDRWRVKLPYPCRVVNLRSGMDELVSGDVLELDLTAGETAWFELKDARTALVDAFADAERLGIRRSPRAYELIGKPCWPKDYPGKMFLRLPESAEGLPGKVAFDWKDVRLGQTDVFVVTNRAATDILPIHDILGHRRMAIVAAGPDYGSDGYCSMAALGARIPLAPDPESERTKATVWLLRDLNQGHATSPLLSCDSEDGYRFSALYSGESRVWANRGKADWTVAGRTIPQDGFYAENADLSAGIVKIGGFARAFARTRQTIFVDARDGGTCDFGGIVTDGAFRMDYTDDWVWRLEPLPGKGSFTATIDTGAFGKSGGMRQVAFAGDGHPVELRFEEPRRIDLQARIDAAARAGGGVVTVPPGRWESAPLVLRSGVTLNLAEDAVLYASTNIQEYASKPGERVFLYAENAENVGLTGKGVLDGRGYVFVESKHLAGESQPQDLPVLIRFSRCHNVLMEDVLYRRSGAWGCHLRNCDGVVVRRVKCYNHSNNTNDGIDIESRNVVIEDCELDTDDDALCIKTESDPSFAVTNVVIRDCLIRTMCNAFKTGTGSYGEVKDVLVENCRVLRPRENWRLRCFETTPGVTNRFTAAGVASLLVVDGGQLENVTIRNVDFEGVRTPFVVRLARRHENADGRGSCLRNVVIENVRGTCDGRIASSVTGVPGLRPKNIVFRNVDVELPGGGRKDARPVPEVEDSYPNSTMFHGMILPGCGFYLRHADRVHFENCRFKLWAADERPLFAVDDCREVVGAEN